MNDDELTSHLAEVVNEPPVVRLLEIAYQSATWIHVDSELGVLLEDSAGLMAGVRSDAAAGARRLSYESTMGVVVIEIDAETRILTGYVGPDAATVTIERSDASITAIDSGAQLASFATSELPSGPARLLIEGPTGAWRTGWFTLP